MEELVPVIAGALAALATWIALSGDGCRRSGRCAGVGRGEGGIKRVRAVLGRRIARAGRSIGAIVPEVVVRSRCVGEPLCACGSAVLGALAVESDSPRALWGAGALACAALGGAGLIVALDPIGLAVGAIAPLACFGIRSRRGEARGARDLESAMPEAFQALAISLGSGHSLAQALMFVGNHAEGRVREEFMRASFSMACGVSATEALDALLSRLPAPGLGLVALSLRVSQRTGAPLKDMLSQAAGMVGERIELKRKLEVRTAQARMSARLVAGMPIAMMAVLSLLSEDFRCGVATATGAASVAIALVLNLVAWISIRKIMEVEL